jgi:hypothetical protein
MYQQLWGYKVEEKLYLGVREEKRLNTTDIDHRDQQLSRVPQVARRKMAEHARLCFKATSWQERCTGKSSNQGNANLRLNICDLQ